jgi:hypothetical protein
VASGRWSDSHLPVSDHATASFRGTHYRSSSPDNSNLLRNACFDGRVMAVEDDPWKTGFR